MLTTNLDHLRRGSHYPAIQTAHNFATTSGLIPDLVIRLRSGVGTKWLLIEVKGGPKRGVADNARAAALDLLAYRRAFAPVLDPQASPYGLGYAWGRGLDPQPDAEVALCSPDTLEAALSGIIG